MGRKLHFRRGPPVLRSLIACLLVHCLCGAVQAAAEFQLPLKIGGGGWNTGVDVCTDGTRYVRTDSYGAYVWDGVSRWAQLLTKERMPAPFFGYFPKSGVGQVNQVKAGLGGPGVYEITSAPSDCSIVYLMALGGIFKSNDKGKTFAKTAFGAGTNVAMAVNGVNRTTGRKM